MSEKQLEAWQEFGRDVANLRAKLLELEGSETHKERIGKNLDSLSRMVEAAARELRSEDRERGIGDLRVPDYYCIRRLIHRVA
jgi:hypothetical protein